MDLADRERRFLVAEMVKTKGLLPVLMKRRNKQKWTAQDRKEIREHLQRLSELSPYLVVVVMPGGLRTAGAGVVVDRRRRTRARRQPGFAGNGAGRAPARQRPPAGVPGYAFRQAHPLLAVETDQLLLFDRRESVALVLILTGRNIESSRFLRPPLFHDVFARQIVAASLEHLNERLRNQIAVDVERIGEVAFR